MGAAGPLLREWDWLQDQVIPPLLTGRAVDPPECVVDRVHGRRGGADGGVCPRHPIEIKVAERAGVRERAGTRCRPGELRSWRTGVGSTFQPVEVVPAGGPPVGP